MKTQHASHDFKGFDDFIEVFRSGTHTAANGVTRTWTNDELDQMVANHSAATAAPIVIGHPEHNDPAYGWTGELKREGDSLLAKFKDIDSDFAADVEKGRYRKRSVRIYKTPANTFAIEHVGFFGAKRTAVPMASMSYSAVQASEVFDFEADWYTPSVFARLMRRIRDWMIAEKGIETADNVIPDWEITSLERHASDLERPPEPAASSPSMFTAQTGEITVTPAEHQAAIDAAVAKAKQDTAAEFGAAQATLQQQLEAERNKNKSAEFSAFINQSSLTPAQATGAVDFMLQLDDAEQFEFSAGDGREKKTPVQWFRDFVASIKPQVPLGRHDGGEPAAGQQAEFTAPHGYAVDTTHLETRAKALAYQDAHPGTDFISACNAVSKQ